MWTTFNIQSIRFALSRAACDVQRDQRGAERYFKQSAWSGSIAHSRGLVILADHMGGPRWWFGLLIRLVKFREGLCSDPCQKYRARCFLGSSPCASPAQRHHPGWKCWSVRSPGQPAALLFMAWMYGVLTADVKKELYLNACSQPWGTDLCCYVAPHASGGTVLPGYYPKLYLWPQWLRYNSLTGNL